LTRGSQDGPSDCPNLPGFPQEAEDPLRSGLASWRADDPIIPGEWVLSTPKKNEVVNKENEGLNQEKWLDLPKKCCSHFFWMVEAQKIQV